LIFQPVTIYLFNILALLVFILIVTSLIQKNKEERNKKEVISLIAHQLSAPLSSIKWTLEMILNNDFGKITEEQGEIFKVTRKKNDHLIYLVENLLDTARIENGKYILNENPSNIKNIIASTIDFYQDEINKKKINFKFDEPENELPKIRVDKQKIELAVQNLLDNAIKYTPVGGNITVSLKRHCKNLEFKIQDSGIGIEKRQEKKVFNKFFRGSNAIKKDPMGHGLGLFFVKNIIEAHKGHVWLESKENEGTSFYFTLPIR